MPTLLLLALLAADPLADAERACERDVKACDLRDELRAQKAAADAKRADEEHAAREAERQRLLAETRERVARVTAEREALEKTCGKDWERVAVGMSWKRVQECSGSEFSLWYADRGAKVYRAESGAVRVERGRVTRVLYH